MAMQHVCDGCGAIIAGEVRTLGIVRRRDYCEACAPDVLRFLAARDALHTETAAHWSTGLQQLKDAFHVERPNARLPDE